MRWSTSIPQFRKLLQERPDFVIIQGFPQFNCLYDGQKKMEIIIFLIIWTCKSVLGHAVARLVEALRYKPEGSIPNGVIGIFHWHNPSGNTMTLESTQPLTEMSTRNISWG